MEKSKVIEKLFLNIVTVSYLLIPLSIGFLFFKNQGITKIPKSLLVYGFAFFLLLLFYSSVPTRLSKYYQSIYTFLEYFFFAYFFYFNINSRKFRRFIIFASSCFLVFQILYLATVKVRRLDSIPIGIETILLLIYIIYFFLEFAKKDATNYIYNHYCFWLAIGVLIYLGGSFFFYMLIDHLNKEEVITFGNLTFLAEFVKNVLFSAAAFIYIRSPLSNSQSQNKSVPYLDLI